MRRKLQQPSTHRWQPAFSLHSFMFIHARWKRSSSFPTAKKKKRNPLTFVFTHPSRNSSSFVPFASKSFGFAPGEAETNIFRLSQESRTIGLEALRGDVPFLFSFFIFFFFERRLFNVIILLFVHEENLFCVNFACIVERGANGKTLNVSKITHPKVLDHHGNEARALNLRILDSSSFLLGRPSLAALLAAAMCTA